MRGILRVATGGGHQQSADLLRSLNMHRTAAAVSRTEQPGGGNLCAGIKSGPKVREVAHGHPSARALQRLVRWRHLRPVQRQIGCQGAPVAELASLLDQVLQQAPLLFQGKAQPPAARR